MTRRQVFGLTGGGACAVPTSVASQLVRASAVDAFVPDYRCGAVPDFNRVPSCDAWNAGEPTQC